MTSMVLYNSLCHGLKNGNMNKVVVVDLVIGCSNVIHDTTLMRDFMRVDELKYKNEITRMYVHDDWGNFPYAAVAKEQKKRNSNTKNGVKMTALGVFRMKHNPMKEFAIELVTKMYDISCEASLTEVECAQARVRYTEQTVIDRRVKGMKALQKRELNKRAFEMLQIKREADGKAAVFKC